MSQPRQTCRLCGRTETVKPDGRGFPPKIAENNLRKWCKNNGCPCDPVYRAGMSPDLEKLLARLEEKD